MADTLQQLTNKQSEQEMRNKLVEIEHKKLISKLTNEIKELKESILVNNNNNTNHNDNNKQQTPDIFYTFL